MADNFTNHAFKTGVAALCQAIGWDSVHEGTIDILSDLWRRQILEVAKLSTNYAMHYGRTEVSLDDTALAFKDLNISVGELEEYVRDFDPVELPYKIPNFPIPKESNLNFLSPESEEVKTRPEHVHEYMPSLNPLTTEEIRKAREAAKGFSKVSEDKTLLGMKREETQDTQETPSNEVAPDSPSSTPSQSTNN